MKTIKIMSLAIILLMGLNSTACKSSKSTTSTTNNKTVVNDNYRLVIAFISKGSGVDAKALEAVNKFLTENSKKPAVEKVAWGREGEQDLCLKLSEFSTKEQKKLIEDLKKLVGTTDLVQFSENAPCVHKN